jgi:opacity protein-like surface antigen
MRIFRLQFFDNKNRPWKKKLLILILFFGLFSLNAQVKLRIEPGFLLKTESENLGLILNVEPNIRISENTVIGLRFGLALNPQKFETNNLAQFRFDDKNDNAVISFIPTFDYYLYLNNTRPYFGIGMGYYLFSSVVLANPSENVSEGSVNNQIGFLLRGGFQLGKTKLGLEYNFIPKADIKIPNGQTIGTVDNSYFGVSIGFTIGGGENAM